MTRFKILLMCALPWLVGTDQSNAQAFGSGAMAGAGAAFATTGWNPNSPAALPTRGLATGATLPYGIHELGSVWLAAGWLGRTGPGLAGRLETFGFKGYRQINVDAQAVIRRGAYQSGVQISSEVGVPDGFRTRVAGSLRFGLQRTLAGPWRAGLIVSGTALTVGGAWESAAAALAADLEQTAEHLILRVGWMLRVAQGVRLDGGLSTTPTVGALGVQIAKAHLLADMRCSVHHPLGWTVSMGVGWLY